MWQTLICAAKSHLPHTYAHTAHIKNGVLIVLTTGNVHGWQLSHCPHHLAKKKKCVSHKNTLPSLVNLYQMSSQCMIDL